MITAYGGGRESSIIVAQGQGSSIQRQGFVLMVGELFFPFVAVVTVVTVVTLVTVASLV